MVTAYVGSRERSGFGLVDALFEALWVRMKSIWLKTSPLGECHVVAQSACGNEEY